LLRFRCGGTFLPPVPVHHPLEVSMRSPIHNAVRFVPLADVMLRFGARTRQAFLNDLRTLSHLERRQVADLVTNAAR
jgi:hypothetical protein